MWVSSTRLASISWDAPCRLTQLVWMDLPVEGITLGDEHIRTPRSLDVVPDPFGVAGIAEGLAPDLAAQRV